MHIRLEQMFFGQAYLWLPFLLRKWQPELLVHCVWLQELGKRWLSKGTYVQLFKWCRTSSFRWGQILLDIICRFLFSLISQINPTFLPCLHLLIKSVLLGCTSWNYFLYLLLLTLLLLLTGFAFYFVLFHGIILTFVLVHLILLDFLIVQYERIWRESNILGIKSNKATRSHGPSKGCPLNLPTIWHHSLGQ